MVIYSHKKTLKKDLIERIEALYTLAFPENERRDFDVVMQILNREGSPFRILVAETETGDFAGFLSFWEWEDFVYGEHFAVEPSLRGAGVGQKMLTDFVGSLDKPMVLEVEPPVDGDITARRVEFYRRNGAVLYPDFDYVQPAYSKDRLPVELKIMSFGSVDERDLPSMVKRIHKEVYGVKDLD